MSAKGQAIGWQLQVWCGHRLETTRTVSNACLGAEETKGRMAAWLLECYPEATIVEREVRL